MNLKPLHCVFAACSDTSPSVGRGVHDAPNPAPAWFQVTPPYGEYPGGASVADADGNPVKDAVIVFDESSTDRVIESFNAAARAADWPGVLVDQEHFSLAADKPSTALAWAKEIRRDPDGSLWTRWEFTERGRELYEGKMLVSRSPVLRLEMVAAKRFAPTELESVGMTNTPHFKTLSPLAKARDNANQKGNTPMDPEILAALGLAPEAGKDEVLAAISQLKDKEAAASAKASESAAEAETEKKRADDAEATCRAMKADAFIAKNSERIADVAAFREAYLANPELVERTLATCKAAASAAPATRIAAKDAKAPVGTSVLDALAKCKSAEERCAFALSHAKEMSELANQ